MPHIWQFIRSGGVDQVVIQTGADLAHLDELDQKLWVALACPTRGLESDPKTLDLIDTDKDGRIRPPELLAACRWACAQLRDPESLVRGGAALALDELAEQDGDGVPLADEARRILDLLDKRDSSEITLEDVADRTKLLAAMRFNGDGIITVKTPQDEVLGKVVQAIIDTQGSVPDRNGEPGIDQARADAFFAQADALHAWHGKALDDATIMPLGAGTIAAAEALERVRAKIDDYFARCRIASYDVRAVSALNPSFDEYRDFANRPISLSASGLSELPLAPVEAHRPLPLGGGINPAWALALETFRTACAEPLLAEPVQTLEEAQWLHIQQRLAAYQQWFATRPASALDKLDILDVEAMLSADAQVRIKALIAQDLGSEPGNARIADLEKLLRFKRDLFRLVNNFVSFSDFYRRKGAIFQAGTLYLDARSCDLTVQVADANKHAMLAGLAKACLAYCECSRQGQKKTIVAAFTAGDTDFLFVGRNGVFYDRDGNDWDATIVKLIDNPTSVAQAFLSPYKKFMRMIEEQVAKRAAAGDASVENRLGALATGIASVDKTPPDATGATPAPAAKPSGRIDVGTVAALGVALGSISAVAVGLFGKFIDLGWWIPVALLGIMLAISGPSMLIAWLKLRQRSLGPILDASGWAINGRMLVNVRLGGSLSQTAHIPRGAQRRLHDPYAQRHGKAWALTVLLVALALLFGVWRLGLADAVLPDALRHHDSPRGRTHLTTPGAASPAAAAPEAPPR